MQPPEFVRKYELNQRHPILFPYFTQLIASRAAFSRRETLYRWQKQSHMAEARISHEHCVNFLKLFSL